MAKGGRGIYNYSVQEAQNVGLGQCGSKYIDDTNKHTGPFVAITALGESVLDESDCDNIDKTMDDAADITIPEGVTIYGHFEVISFSGTPKVLAYYAGTNKA